jgi:dienelactone hydrolase
VRIRIQLPGRIAKAEVTTVNDPTRREMIGVTAAGVLSGVLSGDNASAAEYKKQDSMSSQQQREQLVECLGGPWPDPCPLRPMLRKTISKDGYRIESVRYEVEAGDRVAAYLLVPDGVDASNPGPAVAVWHQHAGQFTIGKSEPAGLAGDATHHTGVSLVKEGYVVLCPDALCFEERQDPAGKLAGMKFERFEFLRYLVNGKCMAWKNILDMRRAVDFLCERPEVDSSRLGCYGHSMGSTHAWMVGPHEPRLKVLIGNCCLPTYAAIHDHRLLHCFPNFVPGWMQYGDTPEIAALIAPRALHLNLGENDGGSPIEHARKGIQRIATVYADQNAVDQFSAFIEPGVGHALTDAMWQKVRICFDNHLNG